MKNKIKYLLISVMCYFLIMSINCNGQNKITEIVVDKTVSKYIIDNNFNLELYELSFCIPEILYVLENDTALMKVFNKRIEKAFNNQLTDASIYIHEIEFENLKIALKSRVEFESKYSASYQFISNMEPKIQTVNFKNYAEPFKLYIKHPEQVDDICIITLLYKFERDVFNNISNDKIANWRFNNWLQYGFEEFRYYPGTLNEAKAIINERIIISVIRKCTESNYILVKESVDMINKVIEKYSNR